MRASGQNSQQKRWLQIGGFLLWASLIAAYWTFHLDVIEPRSTWQWFKEWLLWPYTLDEDATWAAFTHFFGFVIFIALSDGSHRRRWVIVTCVVAFSFYWLLLLLQVPIRLWSAATQLLGFTVMLITLVVGLGLFSALAQVQLLFPCYSSPARTLTSRPFSGCPCDAGTHTLAHACRSAS